nr:hypothetical protein CFP56_30792 [Quercus suber]
MPRDADCAVAETCFSPRSVRFSAGCMSEVPIAGLVSNRDVGTCQHHACSKWRGWDYSRSRSHKTASTEDYYDCNFFLSKVGTGM